MVQLLAYRRLLAVGACAVGALLFALTPNSAEARTRHRGYHSHYSHHHHHHHAGRHHARRHHHFRRHRGHRSEIIGQGSRSYAALLPQDGQSIQAPQQSPIAAVAGAASNVVAEARRYLGGNPTGRSSLWCARFMNMVLQRSGHRTTGSDMASSFASYGTRVSGPQVGAIAVMSRGRRGGHVGVVSGIDAKGNPIVVSGNHGHRVAESTYSRNRIYAYVMPN